MGSSNYILGNKVKKFESEFANFNKIKYCLGVSDGTRALEIAIRSISSNPYVFIPTHTAVATAMAVSSYVDTSKISLIDVSKNSFNMSLEDLKNKFRKAHGKYKNKYDFVCIFVPIYGSLEGIEEISMFCKKNKIKLIIDSAQAHGAFYKNKDLKISKYSDISTYSFYPTKNLPAFGDAGAICFNKKSTYDHASLLREYGWKPNKRNNSMLLGFNSRLDEIQAGLLSIGLKKLNTRNSLRREFAKPYLKYFKDQDRIQHYHNGCVFHQLVIETKNRTKFIKEAAKKGVALGIHYPMHVGQQKPFKHITKSLDNANLISNRILSMPISPEMTTKEAEFSFNTITKLYEKFNR